MRYVKFVLIAGVIAMLLAGVAFAQGSILPPTQPVTIDGVITAIDLQAGSVTLAPANAITSRVPIIFFVNAKTQIVKNEKVVPLSALAVRDLCKAVVVKQNDGKLIALSVFANSPTPPVVFARGRIDKIDSAKFIFTLKLENTMGPVAMVTMFSVDATTTIIKNGKPAAFADLKSGDIAAVGYIPPMTLVVGVPVHAVSVEAKTPPEMAGVVYGKLVEIDPVARIIGVQPDSRMLDVILPVVRLRVTSGTTINKFGIDLFDSLMLGDIVSASFLRASDAIFPPALNITVVPDVFQGFVTGVDYDKGVVIAQVSPMGISVMFKAVEKTAFYKNGRPATIKEILPKDNVTIRFFHFKDGNVAVSVYAKSPVTITPPITR